MKVRAIIAAGRGGTDVLREQDIELVWPAGPRDVLVRLRAASINPADIFFREHGGYIATSGEVVLGHDGAGVVVAIGSECVSVKPGDRVCFCYGGIGGHGTYAEAVVVPEPILAKMPETVSFSKAAASALVSITAIESLRHRAQLRPDETVLVHAGAGGTGHVALQIAKHIGARVATTVSSRDKQEFVAALGADLTISYRDDDFVESAMRWTGGQGLDAAFDNVGGETLRATYRAMRPYGRVVTLIGMPSDDGTAYNANLSVHNEMMLTPMWLGLADRLLQQAGMLQEALDLMEDGALDIKISAEFPLERVADAHALIEKGGCIGKITLLLPN